MWIAAAGIGLLYIGSTLLTPLYPIYRRQFHFSELIVTAVYAVYVIGNLAVLFFFRAAFRPDRSPSRHADRNRDYLLQRAAVSVCKQRGVAVSCPRPQRLCGGLGRGRADGMDRRT